MSIIRRELGPEQCQLVAKRIRKAQNGDGDGRSVGLSSP
jgi:hypothetical protein